MSAIGNPFIIEEAEIFLTRAADASAVWLGGCARDLTLSKELTEVPVEYHGEPNSAIKHTTTSHTIEIENVWLLDTVGLPMTMPDIEIGVVYGMVIIWKDEDTGYFAKITYSGVTGRVQKIGSQAMQNLSYRAESRVIETGLEELP